MKKMTIIGMICFCFILVSTQGWSYTISKNLKNAMKEVEAVEALQITRKAMSDIYAKLPTVKNYVVAVMGTQEQYCSKVVNEVKEFRPLIEKQPEAFYLLMSAVLLSALEKDDINELELMEVTGIINSPYAYKAKTAQEYEYEKQILPNMYKSYAIYVFFTEDLYRLFLKIGFLE